tara:strand:- start:1941 stop:2768 length:828 start_codon:yes stop_codon:yes gene_type:complete
LYKLSLGITLVFIERINTYGEDDMADLKSMKQEVFDYINLSLGGGMVDVELDPEHYEMALKKSLAKFRQRSDNSVEESYMFLPTVIDQNTYILPDETIEVRKIFRRSIGSRSGGGDGGTLFEPFNMAYTNTYLLASTNMGGLATYNMFTQYQELVGRMFGSFIEFKWNTTNKELVILQRPRAEEELLLYCYNYRPDSELLKDYLATQWIKDFALATCKYALGEARSKFATIAGPQGGSTLNGDALKNEAVAEMEKLEEELKLQVAGGIGYGFTIG